MKNKTPKTFRLSDEAVRKLEEQPNATQYLENLILNKTTSTRDILEELKDIKQLVLSIKNYRPMGSINIKNLDEIEYIDGNPVKKVYSGKFLIGYEDVKLPHCICPFERNERGLLERVGTDEECTVHA